jgi:hypothetical protein
MKHGDIVRSRDSIQVGRVHLTETDCSIRSLEDDDNNWVIRASNVKQFKSNWRVVHTNEKKGRA